MLCYRINGFVSSRILGGGYWYSKKRSCGQKTSNLASLSAKKGRTASGMILVLTDIVVVMLDLLSVLLGMINIMLQSYHFLTCQ